MSEIYKEILNKPLSEVMPYLVANNIDFSIDDINSLLIIGEDKIIIGAYLGMDELSIPFVSDTIL
jgi:hypothetical protein